MGSRQALCSSFVKVKVQEAVYDVINRVHWVCTRTTYSAEPFTAHSNRRPEYATTGASPSEVTAVCECCAPGGGTGPTVRSLSAHEVVGYSSVHIHTDCQYKLWCFGPSVGHHSDISHLCTCRNSGDCKIVGKLYLVIACYTWVLLLPVNH